MTDNECMRLALSLAQEAFDAGETPVGCVITKDGEVVGVGRNRREGDRHALAHAELIAIDQACRTLGGWRLWQCTLYVTLEPCPMCAGAIVCARIPRVVFGASDTKGGGMGGLFNLLDIGVNHKPSVESGLMADESAALLRGFFRQLRTRPPE